MPSAAARHPVVKLVTVGGDPRDPGRLRACSTAQTLAPRRADRRDRAHEPAHRGGLRAGGPPPRGAGRTAAARLRPRPAGARARRRAAARAPDRARRHARAATTATSTRSVAAADVICCCTTAREPLFDGALVADHATVVAIGSHEPDGTRDRRRARRAGHDRRRVARVGAARGRRRDPGDRRGRDRRGRPGHAGRAGRAARRVGPAGPRLFKSTGMSWEDAVVAAALAVDSGG